MKWLVFTDEPVKTYDAFVATFGVDNGNYIQLIQFNEHGSKSL